jgi:hypothetical protein
MLDVAGRVKVPTNFYGLHSISEIVIRVTFPCSNVIQGRLSITFYLTMFPMYFSIPSKLDYFNSSLLQGERQNLCHVLGALCWQILWNLKGKNYKFLRQKKVCVCVCVCRESVYLNDSQ